MISKSVLVINGSPRIGGNTDVLTASLAQGATSLGKRVEMVHVRDLDMKGCIGCYSCQMGVGSPCLQKDGMQKIYDAWTECEAVVFATPVYWMQVSSQLKAVIDRLFAISALEARPQRAALIASAAGGFHKISEQHPFIEQYFDYLCEVYKFEDAGRVLAGGVGLRGQAKVSEAVKEAYALGRSI